MRLNSLKIMDFTEFIYSLFRNAANTDGRDFLNTKKIT